MAGICKKVAFVTVPTENSVLVYSQGFTYICKVLRVFLVGQGKKKYEFWKDTLAEWQQAAWYDIFPAVLPFPERVC